MMRTFVSELQSFICPDEPAGKIVVDYKAVGMSENQRGEGVSTLESGINILVRLLIFEGFSRGYICPY